MTSVGISVHDQVFTVPPAQRRPLLERIAGLDHVVPDDRVSFNGGAGFDGMVGAANVLATDDRLSVMIGVYQPALRHPMTVARQPAPLGTPDPDPLDVGVRGEGRSEVNNCGVDPATRGRVGESLGLLPELATGRPVSLDGEFFRVEATTVLPAPQRGVATLIGRKSDATVRRTVRYRERRLAMFVPARRFVEFREQIRREADELERPEPEQRGFQVRCGLDDDATNARELVGSKMHDLHKPPSEKFESLSPAGTPDQVADFRRPHLDVGARQVALVSCAPSWQAGVDAVAGVRDRLAGHH
ncbi:MAG TPA: LLM class flavin-dependent oxidoreductase [Pseudonocardia sp.]|jgi:alkanesulfonate monooxygenase SsuD/methylene tetrahydromethanopterin reductase-like flavin-dependent oxidoreductase (luciferase family)|nr:LLM class flavin-dependent oxidoreductase [Pseudonocardia sp.]